MKNKNQFFNEILGKLQKTLNAYKCKSEIKLSDQEAILYGKLTVNSGKFTIVAHIKEEGYTPATTGSGKHDTRQEESKISIMPSLNAQLMKSQKSNCSQEEQLAMKNKFIAAANEIGEEYLRKINE